MTGRPTQRCKEIELGKLTDGPITSGSGRGVTIGAATGGTETVLSTATMPQLAKTDTPNVSRPKEGDECAVLQLGGRPVL